MSHDLRKGKALPDATKQRIADLLRQGLSTEAISERLRVSKSAIKRIRQEGNYGKRE